jgi:hypothetical protein
MRDNTEFCDGRFKEIGEYKYIPNKLSRSISIVDEAGGIVALVSFTASDPKSARLQNFLQRLLGER